MSRPKEGKKKKRRKEGGKKEKKEDGILALEKKCSQSLVYIPVGKWLFKSLRMLSQANTLRNKSYM